jgi:hypothetical protein
MPGDPQSAPSGIHCLFRTKVPVCAPSNLRRARRASAALPWRAPWWSKPWPTPCNRLRGLSGRSVSCKIQACAKFC